MNNNYASSLSIVTTSCDAYADILDYYSHFFHKYWPDCVYRKVLATQTVPSMSTPNAFDHIYAWGEETTWSQRLLLTLKSLNTPYFMLVLDDFFICDYFKNEQAAHYLDILKQRNACGIRLAPLPRPQKRITNEYGEYPKSKAYRVSAQVCIWDRKYMISLLEELGSCELWYFERYGSFLSEKYEQKSLGTYRKVFPYTEVICKSLWIASALRFLKKEGVEVDLEMRGREATWFLLYRKIRGLIFRINPTLITKIKLFFSKGTQGR